MAPVAPAAHSGLRGRSWGPSIGIIHGLRGRRIRAAQAGPASIDDYIAGFPDDIQAILQAIRLTIRQAAPEATETIKYQMPTFVQHGNLVHFAAFKQHIGLYPAPSGTEAFKDELAAYAGGKGSLKFPIDQPMPLDLISRIAKFRIKENTERAAAKKQRR